MYPLLLELGPIKLYSYGLMMAIGFFLAIHWGMRRALRYGVSSEFISNLSWILVLGGIIGGRAAYLAVEESIDELFSLKFFEVWQGGMVFYGGFILAVIGALFYSRKHNVPFLTVADILSPCIALGHALGRVGCLLAGCCFGKQCDLPWAIEFTHPLSLAPLHIRLHPTQIYESLGNFIVIALLLLIERKQKFRGQIFAIYLVLYAILRASVEVFRGDVERGFITFGGLYPNEWLSTSTGIAIVMTSIALLIYFKQRTVTSLKVK